jgi:type I restriction-modification system DNA methylase subunit
MPAPDAVLKLCETFADHRDHFRSGNYNEAQLRKEFLDPFFAALGWDMDNNQGLAPQYRDVIHEDAIKIGPHVKAPDYAFTLHGQRKFFLEAKKPSVDIKGDVAPAYQLRRYAWSAKLPLSILSDFEEFAIYDTRIKPAPGDPSSKARTLYCTCDQYAEKWDEIASIFSRDAILKGSFDKYADSAKKKKGTAEVDTAFLEEIERWRDLLARNFALRNPSLNVRDLNFAVQKTIDRLVFLRICEDRGTEDYGRLRIVANGTQTYPRLLELFRAADARYNSGLFHFSKEKGQAEEPDTLTPNLALDDKTLKDIIAHLYYPDSPYEFSVLPADILGSVYERFLGKTIRLTDGHQAKIEEKPEVRKAGGVYYTPSYIVDYIVQNTLGKLLTPDPEKSISLPEAAKLKVVDPACGSGSFLIVAYQFLLDWHRDRYAENPEKCSKGKSATLYQAKGGEWRLTTAEKKRILLNNIHGVDIDAAAVEVTKLSLLLKVLEGETGEIAQRDFLKERERILPDLANNIKCGNSLIGPDFYDQPEMDMLDDEARFRVNVFDWKAAFPEVFKQGGFDCVIGNPPYVRQESIKEMKSYLGKKYESASNTADLYAYFIEKAVVLLRDGGMASYIVSSSFLKAAFGADLRRVLKKKAAVTCLTDFGGLPVFESAKDTYVCIPVFRQIEQPPQIHIRRIDTLEATERAEQLAAPGYTVPQERFNEEEWSIRTDTENGLLERLCANYPSLEKSVSSLYYGLKTGLNECFHLTSDQAYILRTSTDHDTPGFIKRIYGGQETRRYAFSETEEYLIVIPAGWSRKNLTTVQTEAVTWNELSARNPALANHLLPFRAAAQKRQDQGDFWWELRPCDYYQVLGNAKIVFPDICKGPRFHLDTTGAYILNTAYAIDSSDKSLLGFLNSKLFWFLISHISIPFGVRAGEFRYRLIYQYMAKIPIRPIDFTNPSDVEKHDRMVSLVDKMLALVPKRRAEANPQATAQLDAQIAATDRQIDRLVYELYWLTEDEILLVEGT